ncbi:ribosomal protein acetylating enzyme [Lentilactobacillus fungorum]|uniref:Ribosomal protein acetylating enzyme n=1 Tax=Lentilactobacillus fungorum TaxID=2201250 RepID=A0ABQ3W3F0_9LACO|nr:GNAT family protein [Lentilactobacillus fungorum]GHP14881.1 ribosomal protein acetylating enzyme [Lentilactobacillus fungorum]
MFTYQVNDKIAFKLPAKADADDLLALIDDDRQALGKWLPWAKEVLTIDDEAKFLQYGIEKMAKGDFWFAIILVNGEPAGMIDLHEINHEHARAQIGYWLARRFQGHGAMHIAVNALVEIAFNDLQLNRIEILADTRNQKSRNVAAHCGFHLDGILNQYAFYNDDFRDMALYAKLKSPLPAKNHGDQQNNG